MTDTFRAVCAELIEAIDSETADWEDIEELKARARTLLAQPEPPELTDEALLGLMPQQFRDDLATVSRVAAHGAGSDITPGIFRVSLNTGALDYARAAIAADRACRPTPQPETEGSKPVVDYSRVTEIATEAQTRSAAQYLVKKRNCDGDLIPAIEYAIARWGRPAAEPPVAGEVAELQRWGVDHGAQPGRPLLSPMEDGYWTPWHIAADPLQRQHPQPVAVSERLPGPEDCDVQGRCWLWERDCGYNGRKWALGDRAWALGQSDEDISVYTHWLPFNALPTPETKP